MSEEVSLSKVPWVRDKDAGPMESYYQLYLWINHTLLMLLLQIFWKMSQISDYFKKSSSKSSSDSQFIFAPLTKELKQRRHIRSMSDVQNSTPYRLPFRSRKGSINYLVYDSDSTRRRIDSRNRRPNNYDSTDSSDYLEKPRKRILDHNIIKQSDYMRIL